MRDVQRQSLVPFTANDPYAQGATARLAVLAARAGRRAPTADPAGSGDSNSIRRPSAGCVNASRAACRNGRSRRCTARTSLGDAPVDAAVESDRRRSGWPIALRCTRIWCVRPVCDRDAGSATRREMLRAHDDARHRAARAARPRATSSAGRPDRGRSARRCARPACTTPQTSAMHSFSTSRSWNCRASSWCAASFFATTITPDVPRSRPVDDARAAVSPPTPLRSSTWWSSALTSVPLLWPAPGCTTIPGGLVDDDEVGVLVEDRERQILGAGGGGPALRAASIVERLSGLDRRARAQRLDRAA